MGVQRGAACVAERDMGRGEDRERIVERAGRIGGEHRVGNVMAGLGHFRSSRNSWRSLSMASRKRDFTVPRGRLVSRLISWCVSSPR